MLTEDEEYALSAEYRLLGREMHQFTETREHVNGFANTPEGDARKARYYAISRRMFKISAILWADDDE